MKENFFRAIDGYFDWISDAGRAWLLKPRVGMLNPNFFVSRVFRTADPMYIGEVWRCVARPLVQGVCQGAGAGGEQGGVPEAAAHAAAREGTQWLCGLDL